MTEKKAAKRWSPRELSGYSTRRLAGAKKEHGAILAGQLAYTEVRYLVSGSKILSTFLDLVLLDFQTGS